MEWNEAYSLQDTDLKCKLGHQKTGHTWIQSACTSIRYDKSQRIFLIQ